MQPRDNLMNDCNKIPYATEQGIFDGVAGNFCFKEQGNGEMLKMLKCSRENRSFKFGSTFGGSRTAGAGLAAAELY